MTVGRIVCSLYHMGTLTTINGRSYALLNGQSVSRSTYTGLSDVWPSGAYRSTTSSMHLPDTNGLYLRGADFGSSNDPDVALRVALSGVLPSGTAVGSYQTANAKSHAHASGTQSATANQIYGGGGENATNSTGLVSTTDAIVSGTSASIGRPIEFNKANVEFDVDNHVVYYYIGLD